MLRGKKVELYVSYMSRGQTVLHRASQMLISIRSLKNGDR